MNFYVTVIFWGFHDVEYHRLSFSFLRSVCMLLVACFLNRRVKPDRFLESDITYLFDITVLCTDWSSSLFFLGNLII